MGRLPFFIEQLGLLGIVIFFLTQVALPLIRSTPLFPIFGTRRRQLEREIARANEERDLAAMEDKLKSLKGDQEHHE